MIRMMNGYEFFVCSKTGDIVPASNLKVIARGADPHRVFDDEMHVHHKNKIRWDNRIENLEVKDKKEHLREHFEENDDITPGSSRPDWWDHDKLYKMYWDDGMTLKEIGDIYGVTRKSVSVAFDKLGLEKRKPGQSIQKPWQDREILQNLYIEKDMTQKEVAEQLGISTPTVRKWLDKTGVWRPTNSHKL